jgi:hypothetical protein
LSTASEDAAARPLWDADALPAPVRWALAFPGSPFWLAAGVGLLYFAGASATVGVSNGPDDLPSHVLYAVYWAWVPLALVVLVRGTARDAVDLSPVLDMDAASLCTRVFAAGSRVLPWSLPLAFVVAGLDVLMFSGMGAFDRATPAQVSFVVTREVLLCIAIFGVLVWAAGAAHALSRAVREHAHLDLLNARPLAPLARCGTRMLLFWVLMHSLQGPFLLFADVHLSVEGVLVLIAVSLLMLALACAALAIPTWGARQALLTAKTAELERVRGQIHAARQARDDTSLPGLLAWEARIASVPEWPIDAGSLRLTGLYVLIPLLSWVGGALVERVVDELVG